VLSSFLADEQVIDCMERSIAEAERSVSEDRDRPPPRVGALLVSKSGEVLLSAHRADGRHAEYNLLEEALAKNISTRGTILFTTLEPCTKRGKEKIPCAERVAAEPFAEVFIGTLDPDPSITGRGELFLVSNRLKVERYPSSFVSRLVAVSKGFFESHKQTHSAHALYTTSQSRFSGFTGKLSLVEERNGLLQLTMDLISGAKKEICVLAGDLSWLHDAQATYLFALHRGCSVRCLVPKTTNAPTLAMRRAAQALGFHVAELDDHPGMIGTLIDPQSDDAAAIFIDRGAATVFRSPDDSRMLSVLRNGYESLSRGRVFTPGDSPRYQAIPVDMVISALKATVPQYQNATITVQSVSVSELKPLTRYLERFKQVRLNEVARLREALELPSCFGVVGSPWPVIGPPVVERRPSGDCVILDGTHRSFTEVDRSATIEAIVIENVDAPLPATPIPSWDAVRVYSRGVDRAVRYTDYDKKHFRPILKAYEWISAQLTSEADRNG
jgi:pyrimidine deaminase RibD-like protein